MISEAYDRVVDWVYDHPLATAAAVLAVAGVLLWRIVLVDGPPRLPDETWKLEEACEDPGRAYPDAAPHGGGPPHPIAVFPELDHEYDESQPWLPDDPSDVQLVACLERVGRASPSETVVTGAGAPLECEYGAPGIQVPGSGRPVPLVTARYRLTLYELRTGREVATEELDGDHHDCPGSILEDDTEVYSTVDLDQLDALLSPYVEGRT